MRLTLLAVGMLVAVLLIPAGRDTAMAASNTRVQVVNLSDHNFWVTWFTDSPAAGSIQFGTSCAATNQRSPEQQGGGYVHLVDAGSSGALSSDTTFYYKIVDSGVVDANGGQCYTARTFHQLASPGVPNAVYGSITMSAGCSSPAPGALVTFTVTHAGTVSLPLAAMTSSTGGWTIVIGSATDASGTPLNAAAGDSIALAAATSASDVQTASRTYQPDPYAPQHLPDLCLSATLPTSTTASPTLTSTITSTPPAPTAGTGTPVATPAPSATPTATSTPTFEPTATTASTGTPAETPSVSPVSTPTGAPTIAVPSAVPTTPATLVPRPSPSPTALQTQPARIKIRAYLVKGSVHPGEKEQMVVYTLGRVRVSIVVSYPNHGGVFHSSFMANKDGLWRRTWVVRTQHRGVASVLLTVVRGQDSRHFHRTFVIR